MDVREFFGAIWWLLRPFTAMVFQAGGSDNFGGSEAVS